MTLDQRWAQGARWAIGGAAFATAMLVSGCAAESGAAQSEEPPASQEASPTPGWAEFGGRSLAVPEPTASADLQHAKEEPVDPAPLPASCAATGVHEHMDGITDRLSDPEFTEVRTEERLECSWADFSTSEGSQVVMVTFAPEKSLVEYPGHVPAAGLEDPAFFTTDEVAELGGVAEWHTGEMFSGVDLHLPGMLVSVSANNDRVDAANLLDAVSATAGELPMGESSADVTAAEDEA